jgi:hypothetical protein
VSMPTKVRSFKEHYRKVGEYLLKRRAESPAAKSGDVAFETGITGQEYDFCSVISFVLST